MLTRLIVGLYVWIIEIALWLALLISSVAGYHYTVPMLDTAGLVLDNRATGGVLGALVFPVVTFVALAVLVGPFLLLVDIRKSVRVLEARSTDDGNGTPLQGVQTEHHL